MALKEMHEGNQLLREVVEEDVGSLEAALDMERWARANTRRILEVAIARDDAERKQLRERMAGNVANFDKAMAQLERTATGAEERAMTEKIKAAVAVQRTSFQNVHKAADGGKR